MLSTLYASQPEHNSFQCYVDFQVTITNTMLDLMTRVPNVLWLCGILLECHIAPAHFVSNYK